MGKYSLKKEYKLSEESAQEQIAILIDYFGIDVDNMKQDAKEATESALDAIVSDIRQGFVEIQNNDKGFKIIQHQHGGGSDIEYTKFGGQIKVAQAGKKEDDYNGKLYAVLGASSGLGEQAIKNLNARNIKIAERLGILFL